ncbi:MAG: phosphoribosylamine--glycine ligase [Chlamydiae bacterium]|nr:phosphoribosylamine--glycine ligase [Chlamydiota bacterium]MBI3276344.1 phosphoribosylamine--glycine ligase [Chlamydiota bacterium]
MKVLVIGSGGREHALTLKISKSPLVKKIYCAPGNPGISSLAQRVDIPIENISGLLDFAKKEKIDLTVVGPELPLSLGIVDQFEAEGLKIFGPSKKAAQLESSKIFSKFMMKKFGIPTARSESFSDFASAKKYIQNSHLPRVIKADGLAAGKGVLVAKTCDEALLFLQKIMVDKIFGVSGENILIEECLEGREISILALSDGENIVLLPEARDYKRALDHDQGLNTGGMGAYSPVSEATEELRQCVLKDVFHPMIRGMKKEGIPYRGVLYAGLMLTSQGPKVLEFNVRFGDPETQVILPRIKSDIVPLFLASCNGTLDKESVQIHKETAICVVLTSGGYPGAYQNGFEILGLDQASKMENIMLFHAGTSSKDGKILTHGGRVLGVTSLGKDMKQAQTLAYDTITKIHFERMHYRRDIGMK